MPRGVFGAYVWVKGIHVAVKFVEHFKVVTRV
jgi:hypothetical protein